MLLIQCRELKPSQLSFTTPIGSVRLRQRKGAMADPGLSVWPGPLSLAGPRSFGLILAGVPWAARAAI
jgi:hypothetical protein